MSVLQLCSIAGLATLMLVAPLDPALAQADPAVPVGRYECRLDVYNQETGVGVLTLAKDGTYTLLKPALTGSYTAAKDGTIAFQGTPPMGFEAGKVEGGTLHLYPRATDIGDPSRAVSCTTK